MDKYILYTLFIYLKDSWIGGLKTGWRPNMHKFKKVLGLGDGGLVLFPDLQPLSLSTHQAKMIVGLARCET